MGAGASSSAGPYNVEWRKEVINRQIDTQNAMCMRLQNNGMHCTNNYYTTYKAANNAGLLSTPERSEFRMLGIQANHAKHHW